MFFETERLLLGHSWCILKISINHFAFAANVLATQPVNLVETLTCGKVFRKNQRNLKLESLTKILLIDYFCLKKIAQLAIEEGISISLYSGQKGNVGYSCQKNGLEKCFEVAS